MKVLQIINSLSSGGAEVFAAGLSIALKKLGCDVEIFTYCGAIDEKGRQLEMELENVGIAHRSPKLRRNLLKPAIPLYLTREIRTFKPDICHSHLEQSDFFLALAETASLKREVKVRTIHNVYAPSVLPSVIHRWLSSSFRANIACGPAVRTEYPYLRTEDIAINNGIQLSRLMAKTDSASIRAKLDVRRHEALFVHIGAFAIRNGELQKAQDVIVQALAKTSAKNYVVAFLGDGERRAAIEKMAEELGVIASCRFLGRVTNPADYIFAADGVLMPSRFEGLSIGCIEAVCAGKPVLASDITAFSPFKKSSTVFVAPNSVQQLTTGIDHFIENIDQLKQFAEEHLADYCNEFDINSVASTYMTCYQNLLNRQNNNA
jgi:glycosyltransferase involved in cell wall biosynthesis